MVAASKTYQDMIKSVGNLQYSFKGYLPPKYVFITVVIETYIHKLFDTSPQEDEAEFPCP